MSKLGELFGFSLSGKASEIPEIYPIGVESSEFVKNDVFNIYSKILIDVLERTQGIPEKYTTVLWDNCLASESNKGLITLIAEAMSDKQDLFLVYKENVLRKADQTEQDQIKKDYEAKGKSSVGIFVSFKKHTKSDMVKMFSAMEYSVVSGLSKTMALSKAIQLKMFNMRSSVGAVDSSKAVAQGETVAKELAKGHDILIDKEDEIVTHTSDIEPIEKSMQFIDGKKCFYLGMPMSYINGEMKKGLGDSGEADSKAVERGLKGYYFSIIKPVVKELFGSETTFKSQDFRMIDQAMTVLKTFELVSDTFLSAENKQIILEGMLGLEHDKVLAQSVAEENSARIQDQKDANQPTNSKPSGAPVSK